jgi:two-component system OmpR family sensor kinase
MKSESIYKQFYNKLIIATSFFIILLSIIFYIYTKNTVYENIHKDMLIDAKAIHKEQLIATQSLKNKNVAIRLVTNNSIKKYKFINFENEDINYIKLLYPFDLEKNLFLEITRNIDYEVEILNSIIFRNLFILAIPGFLLMLVFSLFLSRSLLKPIIDINNTLSNMDESSLTKIDKKDLPVEFHTLTDSLNALTNRIETNIKFKKELFIGAAHELKTPLAVMKLKNEVTLRKKREINEYEDTLNLSIKSINDMNIMISSILDIGRAEGAQFEKTTNIDIVEYTKNKVNDYRLLSAQKNITLNFFSNVTTYRYNIQVTLYHQILQNFVQNAIKFTDEKKTIAIRLRKTQEELILTVTDEGIGIKEDIDLFAPFKRIGNKSGVGLGLFLAKNASDALRADISIKNRNDGQNGCIAKLVLHNT